MKNIQFDIGRYNFLQSLREKDCMTDSEKDELIAMCTSKLDELMEQHKDVFIRLKAR